MIAFEKKLDRWTSPAVYCSVSIATAMRRVNEAAAAIERMVIGRDWTCGRSCKRGIRRNAGKVMRLNVPSTPRNARAAAAPS